MEEARPRNRRVRQNRQENGTGPKSYVYNSENEGLPVYGVIVQWDATTKYSNKAIKAKFEHKLAPLRKVEVKPNKSSLKHKPMPYFRRIGPSKGMVMFEKMDEANDFSKQKDAEFHAFIPLSFITVVGVTVFNKINIKFKEFQSFCRMNKDILQYRKKRLIDNQMKVTIAIRGTKLPPKLMFNNDYVQLTPNARLPVFCSRCLRYGHLIGNCMRKPRCGVCIRTKPALKHGEKKCLTINRSGNIERCIFCQQNHTIGTEGCVEHTQQCAFKVQLVKHNMDFVSELELEIIPSIRTTSINSSRAWLD